MSRTVTLYCWRNLSSFISGFFFLYRQVCLWKSFKKMPKKRQTCYLLGVPRYFLVSLLHRSCQLECWSWGPYTLPHCSSFQPKWCVKISSSKAFLLEWTVLRHLGKYFYHFCVALLNKCPIIAVASKNKLDLNYWNNCYVFVVSESF